MHWFEEDLVMMGYTFLDEGVVDSDAEGTDTPPEAVLVAASMIVQWETEGGILKSIADSFVIDEVEVETMDIQFCSAYVNQWLV